jgi:hypothetical protein
MTYPEGRTQAYRLAEEQDSDEKRIEERCNGQGRIRTLEAVAPLPVFEATTAKAETFIQSGNDSNLTLPYRSAKGYAARVFAQL